MSLVKCPSMRHGALHRTERPQHVYTAGVEEAPPSLKGLISTNIVSGLYTWFTHDDPLETIQETLNHIYNSWLPQSEWPLNEHSPYIERYTPYTINKGIDIFIGIQPKYAY
jgi:predicted transcriptional regulator YdeE